MQELDRILEGENVAAMSLVDVVDEGRHRARLARPGHARHEDHSALDFSDPCQDGWEAELLDRRHFPWNDAHDNRERASLPHDVDAKAADALRRPRAVVIENLVDLRLVVFV